MLILGAGPTGIGAAHRLNDLGHRDWDIYEQHDYIGGLAASFTDESGFVWDIGGHVLFSHYDYFDQYVDGILKEDYLAHERRSFIRMLNNWVPYPFQNNIRYLNKDIVLECLVGLLEASKNSRSAAGNFRDWISATFGAGIAKHFMLPYNEMVWKFPLEEMSKDWIAERVSVIDFERVLRNVILERDDVGWGPNSKFKFPLHGGTGTMFEGYRADLGDHLHLNHRVRSVDLESRAVEFENGEKTSFDVMVTSIPLDELALITVGAPESVRDAASRLATTAGVMIGLGFKKPCPSDKCWMYFPESNSPFYRVTYFSNYSPNNVPDSEHYSLVCEISCPPGEVDAVGATAVESSLNGLVAAGLLSQADIDTVVSTKVIKLTRSYPVPTIARDQNLKHAIEFFEGHDILSRGRFGGWRYEIGNTDHSFMQGKEAVDRLMSGEQETVWTPLP
ncbi:MAG: FAD-dependent oxidoreductase [Candidatus Coatesbacteria bacterium]|nr:FAD-dependent oxidoreductase [Candidatus Coatesbacteria bacterium]